MFTGAIPNPTKTFTVSYPYQTCKDLMDNFNSIITRYKMSGYELVSKDEVLGTYTFKKGEILSFGVHIIIGVQPSGENTAFTVEVQRLIGAFDQAHEIGMANRYLNEILQAISMGLNPPSETVAAEFVRKQEIYSDNGGAVWTVILIILLPFLITMCS